MGQSHALAMLANREVEGARWSGGSTRRLAHGACWAVPFCCRRLSSTVAYLIRAVSSNLLWGGLDYCGLCVRIDCEQEKKTRRAVLLARVQHV